MLLRWAFNLSISREYRPELNTVRRGGEYV
jgi:hypothetical protein